MGDIDGPGALEEEARTCCPLHGEDCRKVEWRTDPPGFRCLPLRQRASVVDEPAARIARAERVTRAERGKEAKKQPMTQEEARRLVALHFEETE